MAFVPQPYAAEVRAVRTPYPGARRIVLSGGDLLGWRSSGLADEWVHVRLPGCPARLYSVRDHDQARAEVVLEISLRSTGPVGSWARRAAVGDRLEISQPAGRYQPPVDAGWVLLVADHAGFPALCRILAEASTGFVRQVVVPAELADAAAAVLDGVPVTGTDDLVKAVQDWSRPDDEGYLWMGAEAAATRAVRRHLRQSWGWTSDRFAVAGYWQRRDQDYERRYRQVEQQVAALYGELQAGTRSPESIADDLDDLLDAHQL